MDRRAFMAAVTGGLLAAPLAGEAQQAGKLPRLGWLGEGPDPGRANVGLLPFIEGLRELGYLEGQHFTLDRRFAGGSPQRLRELAAELVGLRVDLIAAPGTQAILAVKAATSTIPVVMLYPGDPVGAGIVTNLSRPAGNITGTSLMFPDASGKRLQILREAVPTLRRVAVLWNPNNASTAADMQSTEQIVKSLGLQIHPVAIDGPGRLPEALGDVTRIRPEGMLVLQDTAVFLLRKAIADFARQNRLPTVFPGRLYVEDTGGLLGYGPDLQAVGRRAATYVDKILKGAKPGDLPIEQPTKFELIVNLKTARALGLAIPPALLLQADQVIE